MEQTDGPSSGQENFFTKMSRTFIIAVALMKYFSKQSYDPQD